MCGCVRLPASCDSAIRRLCFQCDVWLRAINIRYKESFIAYTRFLRRYPAARGSLYVLCSGSSLLVCVLRAASSGLIEIKRGRFCNIKLPHFLCRLHPLLYSLRRSLNNKAGYTMLSRMNVAMYSFHSWCVNASQRPEETYVGQRKGKDGDENSLKHLQPCCC
jgi:hypothetical protein